MLSWVLGATNDPPPPSPVLPITKFTTTNYDLQATRVAEVNVDRGIGISALEFIVIMYNVDII